VPVPRKVLLAKTLLAKVFLAKALLAKVLLAPPETRAASRSNAATST